MSRGGAIGPTGVREHEGGLHVPMKGAGTAYGMGGRLLAAYGMGRGGEVQVTWGVGKSCSWYGGGLQVA